MTLVFHSCDIVFPRLSFEYFPPRNGCDLVRMIGHDFYSNGANESDCTYLTCRDGNASKLASVKYLLFMCKSWVTYLLSPHIICRNYAPSNILGLVHSLARMGTMCSFILIGDQRSLGYGKVDISNVIDLMRKIRLSNFFHISANYPDTHLICLGLYQGMFSSWIKYISGGIASVTQFFNNSDAVLRASTRYSSLISNAVIPGLLLSSRRQLGFVMNLNCGAYLGRDVKEVLWFKPLPKIRILLLLSLYSKWSLYDNSLTWIQIFTLNNYRISRWGTWLMNDASSHVYRRSGCTYY